MARNVLVTGCAGFIGSHLVDRLLEQGFNVVGTDFSKTMQPEILNKGIRFYDLDVRKKQDSAWDRIFRENSIDTVFHVSAYAAEIMSLYRPSFITETNVVGSSRVMEAALRNSAERLVFISSNSVYGFQEKCPYGEDVQKQPDDIYAIGKLATEEILKVLCKVHGMDYTIVRPHNVFGPRQNIADPYRNVIGIWMNRIKHGKKPVIYGDGLQERAFTYIDDLVWPTAKAGTSKQGRNETFNIGTDENVTIKKAAEIVCREMGFSEGVEFVAGRPQEVKISYPGHEKARKILDFEAKWGFEDGVKAMAEWARQTPAESFEYFESVEIEKNMPITWKEKSL